MSAAVCIASPEGLGIAWHPHHLCSMSCRGLILHCPLWDLKMHVEGVWAAVQGRGSSVNNRNTSAVQNMCSEHFANYRTVGRCTSQNGFCVQRSLSWLPPQDRSLAPPPPPPPRLPAGPAKVALRQGCSLAPFPLSSLLPGRGHHSHPCMPLAGATKSICATFRMCTHGGWFSVVRDPNTVAWKGNGVPGGGGGGGCRFRFGRF